MDSKQDELLGQSLPYGIVKKEDKFVYLEYRYDRLEDAIAYAEKQNIRQQQAIAEPPPVPEKQATKAGKWARESVQYSVSA